MNTKNIKHKLALACASDINTYFEQVAIVNQLQQSGYSPSSETEFLKRVGEIYNEGQKKRAG